MDYDGVPDATGVRPVPVGVDFETRGLPSCSARSFKPATESGEDSGPHGDLCANIASTVVDKACQGSLGRIFLRAEEDYSALRLAVESA